MRLSFVNPPKTNVYRGEVAPPLGLMRLAGLARAAGHDVTLCDLNLLHHLDLELHTRFYERAGDILLAQEADVYAFTSMCVDTHVALELARRLKIASPGVVILVGGVHFSSVAEAIRHLYPWIDIVVRGEGESAFIDALRIIKTAEHFHEPQVIDSIGVDSSLPGADFREYDMVNLALYFGVNPYRTVDIESGRGCRFKCKFCYSPTFYTKTRDYATSRIIDELSRLHHAGVARFFLVNDNFANDVPHALAFCRDLSFARLSLRWSCYATLPQLSDPLMDAMAEAGCESVFCGVDAVGPVEQRRMNKSFFKSAETFAGKVDRLARRGIVPTCAFLLSPTMPDDELRLTLDAALTARMLGAEIRLNTLTPYNGTPVHDNFLGRYAPDEAKIELLLDVPSVVVNNPFAVSHPELFPFHSRYVNKSTWRRFIRFVHCAGTLLNVPAALSEFAGRERGNGLVELVANICVEIPHLLRLPKEERRNAEQLLAMDLISHPASCRVTLDARSSNVLLRDAPLASREMQG